MGVLNRLRASLIFVDHPELNVTSSCLTVHGITLKFQEKGDFDAPKNPPNDYLIATVIANLARPQAQRWKTKLETNAFLGNAILRSDSADITPYFLRDCRIVNIGDQDFSGIDPNFPFHIRGIYEINGESTAP